MGRDCGPGERPYTTFRDAILTATSSSYISELHHQKSPSCGTKHAAGHENEGALRSNELSSADSERTASSQRVPRADGERRARCPPSVVNRDALSTCL